VGIDTVHAQQTTYYEIKRMSSKRPLNTFCPRKNAIMTLHSYITSLQQLQHAIVLMIDANQASKDCYTSTDVRPYTIEWLRITCGLLDPFVELHGHRPNSTTINPNRDIDYVFTWNISPVHISTLPIHTPASSDHLGILIDFDLATFFETSFSDIASPPTRFLTSGNKKSVDSYTAFLLDQFSNHKIQQRTFDLLDKALKDPTQFSPEDQRRLNSLDQQLTEILLAGKRQCCKKHINRQPWSPQQQLLGRTITYWKQKLSMYHKRFFYWAHLDKLRIHLHLSDQDHAAMDLETIVLHLRQARRAWKKMSKSFADQRREFLQEKAILMAQKMHTDEEKALKAILNAEQSKRIFRNIRDITGKQQTPLTQVDNSTPMEAGSTRMPSTTTLTTKEEIEQAIIRRNQRHSKQSLATPFAADPTLSKAVSPEADHRIDDILDGSFLDLPLDHIPINDSERQWIQELCRRVHSQISLHISLDDFKHFFARKQENTASSPSGRLMGSNFCGNHHSHCSNFAYNIYSFGSVGASCTNYARKRERSLH
jgi:hypothetical protein